MGEEAVVLEEVAVPRDVAHHQLLIDEAVALEEVGVAGVGVDDELVDLGPTPFMPAGQALVLHAKAPRGVTRREAAVGSQGVDVRRVEHLEDDIEERQAGFGSDRLG